MEPKQEQEKFTMEYMQKLIGRLTVQANFQAEAIEAYKQQINTLKDQLQAGQKESKPDEE